MQFRFRKAFILLLVVGLLLSMFPAISLAEDETDDLIQMEEEETFTENVELVEEVGPIKIHEVKDGLLDGTLYSTLNEAIAAAEGGGYGTYTLEVIDGVTETNNVIITSNVTIVGGDRVDFVSNYRILVQGGGILTLGSGSRADSLTIEGNVRVSDGKVYVQDGAAVIDKNSYGYALYLEGPNARGAISGGRIEGYTAIGLDKGAQLSEISGGVFTGKQDTVHVYGQGTKIGKISGGNFYQTDTVITLHGHTIFVDTFAEIGEISGGYFEAVRHCALVVIRGGWVGTISGGEFVAKRRGLDFDGNAPDPRNAVVRIEAENNHKTGIGTISGGLFHGGAHFGILLINYFNSNTGPRIDLISGGDIQGYSVGLQPDVGTYVGEISGGKITASQGMLNAGTIGKISGNVEILGTGSYAIYNYTGGRIEEISGGKMAATSNNGIANAGTIKLISGGTFIGSYSAISCTGLNKGKIETITGGVFWGKNFETISLAYEVKLEPGLNALKGFGRYWANGGKIFNNESLVVYPEGYKMSALTETDPVTGINDVQFRYLTRYPLFFGVTFNANGGSFDTGIETMRTVTPPETSVGAGNMPKNPTWSDHMFKEWNTRADGTGTAFNGTTTVGGDITVYAQWTANTPNNPGGGGDDGGGGTTNPPVIGPETEDDEEGDLDDEEEEEPKKPLPPFHGDSWVPDGDHYIEFGEDGTPVGEWHYDDDLGKWIFDEYPPLQNLPQTGESGMPEIYLIMIALSLMGYGIASRFIGCRKGR